MISPELFLYVTHSIPERLVDQETIDIALPSKSAGVPTLIDCLAYFANTL
jgi:hypothetical protein